MSFDYPLAFLLLLLLPFVFFKTKNQSLSLLFSHTELLNIKSVSFKAKYHLKFQKIIRFFSLFLLITALARPKTVLKNQMDETKGIDILMAIDVSSSMLAEDFTIGIHPKNRLDVVKKVISRFIRERENDRIGLLIFSGEVMTVCPLSSDYSVLSDYLRRIEVGVLPDKTAIGDAIARSVNRLKKSGARSKIIILLTDGDNNHGKIDPLTGADLAESQGIRVYTIGVGKTGKVPFPVYHPLKGKTYVYKETPVNENILKKIALKTNGKFFRAVATEELQKIYQNIDQMEKTTLKNMQTYKYLERFQLFLIPALLLICLECFFMNFIFLKIP